MLKPNVRFLTNAASPWLDWVWAPWLIALVLALCVAGPQPISAQDDNPDPPAFGGGDSEDDDDQVPKNARPLAPLPENLAVENELLTDAEEDQLRRDTRGILFTTAMRAGVLDPQSRELIEKMARYYVYQLSMRKYRNELSDRAKKLFTALRSAGDDQANAQLRNSFRGFVLQEITARLQELLDGHLLVRIQAVNILGQLNLVEPKPASGVDAVAYKPALDLLLQVIQDPNQPDSVKVVAVGDIVDRKSGIQNMIATLNLDAAERLEIAQALVKEIKRPEVNPWYQIRAIEALCLVDLAVDGDNEPFIVQLLAEIIKDEKLPWDVRATAAYAFGRVRVNGPGVNLDAIVYEIARLAQQMVVEADKQPGRLWPNRFFRVYLAFRPLNVEERERLEAGLLTRYAPNATVQGAYRAIIPVVNHFLGKNAAQVIPAAKSAPLDTWLKDNKPVNPQIAGAIAP